MSARVFRFFLFPQTVLSEGDFRLFSILLPDLSILQTLRPPTVPEWGKEQFSGWPAILDSELLDKIKLCYRGYQDFAALHGNESGLAAISHELISSGYSESRFQIQGRLRGKDVSPAEHARSFVVEAATFLEMARDLDEREMELESGISEVDHLEEQFREILGISTDEELVDVVETVTPPLVPERNLSFRLPKRMASWLRLLTSSRIEETPILVTTSEEVLVEAIEALSKDMETRGREFKVLRSALCRIPQLRSIAPKDFSAVREELTSSGSIQACWKALEDLLRSPEHLSFREVLKEAWNIVENQLSSFAAKSGDLVAGSRECSLAYLKGAEMGELWKCLDREGHRSLADAFPSWHGSLVFLVIH